MRLISINVERSKHLERILPFLDSHEADVVCIQELAATNIEEFENLLDMKCTFAPMGLHPDNAHSNKEVLTGIGLFTPSTQILIDIEYYKGSEHHARTASPHKIMVDLPIIMARDINIGGKSFAVATVHFTWSPRGSATEMQRADMHALLEVLRERGEFVLCGDFNTPRGSEIFTQLANNYTDAIPAHYNTSLDVNLHRAGKDRPQELSDKMVDGLFLTSSYQASDVMFHTNTSDHMALTASIEVAF